MVRWHIVCMSFQWFPIVAEFLLFIIIINKLGRIFVEIHYICFVVLCYIFVFFFHSLISCRFDVGRDGFLDLTELKFMMEKIGAPQTHLGLKGMIAEVDEDNDGKISFREFMLIYRWVIVRLCVAILTTTTSTIHNGESSRAGWKYMYKIDGRKVYTSHGVVPVRVTRMYATFVTMDGWVNDTCMQVFESQILIGNEELPISSPHNWIHTLKRDISKTCFHPHSATAAASMNDRWSFIFSAYCCKLKCIIESLFIPRFHYNSHIVHIAKDRLLTPRFRFSLLSVNDQFIILS